MLPQSLNPLTNTEEIVTLFERLGELIDITHVEVIHDYEETCYRLEIPGRVKVLLPPHNIVAIKRNEDWHEFLQHVKKRGNHG